MPPPPSELTMIFEMHGELERPARVLWRVRTRLLLLPSFRTGMIWMLLLLLLPPVLPPFPLASLDPLRVMMDSRNLQTRQ